jgi:hypothetical protein
VPLAQRLHQPVDASLTAKRRWTGYVGRNEEDLHVVGRAGKVGTVRYIGPVSRRSVTLPPMNFASQAGDVYKTTLTGT